LAYISPTAKDYDNVFVATAENENFKLGFVSNIAENRGKKITSNQMTFRLVPLHFNC
jgi:hypothetical protein